MAPRTVVELENLPREEWLEARRGGIGSSDVAGICGLSRHSSQFSVWLDKTGQAEEEPENQMMRMGRLLEDPVAIMFEDATGYRTSKPPAMYKHASIDHMLASPDRFVGEQTTPEVLGLLEIKTGRNEVVWEAGPPLAVQLQLTHQMIVTERSQGWIAVLLNGRDFDFWPMNLDDELAESIIQIEDEFWQRVLNRQEPPADGHQATAEALKARYRDVNPGAQVALDHLAAEIRGLGGVKAQIAELETTKAKFENTIKQAMGDAEIGTFAGVPYVTWKAASAFDEERFAAEAPDLAAEFRKDHAGPRKFLTKKGV